MTGLQQLLNDFLIAVEAIGLVKRPFVILHTQPGHAFQNGIDGFGGRTLQIRILDAQHELATMLAGIEPGKQRGACASDV